MCGSRGGGGGGGEEGALIGDTTRSISRSVSAGWMVDGDVRMLLLTVVLWRVRKCILAAAISVRETVDTALTRLLTRTVFTSSAGVASAANRHVAEVQLSNMQWLENCNRHGSSWQLLLHCRT